MSVTLKDLAKTAGVSVGTVSRALNDKKEVSAKTSDRIRQLAAELGYIPNRAGRALSAQKSISYIGVVLPSINSPFFDDIKRGIENATRELKDLGVDVVLEEEQGWDPKAHLEAIGRLQSRGCKAFILCTVDSPEICEKINSISAEGLPVVLINNNFPEANHICYVGPDYYKSGQIAAAMLDKCKQEQELKILIVVGYKSHLGHKRRLEGFIKELDKRDSNYQIIDIVEGHDKDIDTQQVTMRAFTNHPEINCIYTATGSGVSGLGAAIIADNQHHRFVIACDEIYTTKELVKNDIIDFVVCQETETQGYQAVKKVHEFLSNKFGAHLDDYIVDNIIKIKNHFE